MAKQTQPQPIRALRVLLSFKDGSCDESIAFSVQVKDSVLMLNQGDSVLNFPLDSVKVWRTVPVTLKEPETTEGPKPVPAAPAVVEMVEKENENA